MRENPFLARRRQYKQQLLEMSNENDIDIKRLLGLFSLKTGLSIKKAEEYYGELKDAGLVS